MNIIYTHLAAEKCRQWSANAGLGEDGKGTLLEVGWIGKVKVEPPDTFLIEDVFLFEQEASGAHFQVTPDMMAKFYSEYIERGGDPGELMHFGHSHANMSVFQSAVDKSNAVEAFWKKPYCVAVTWNAKGEVYGEVTIFTPIFYRVEKVPVLIRYPEVEVDLTELREKVRRPAPVVYTSLYNNGYKREDFPNLSKKEFKKLVKSGVGEIPNFNPKASREPSKGTRDEAERERTVRQVLTAYNGEAVDGKYDGVDVRYHVWHGTLYRGKNSGYMPVDDINEKWYAVARFRAEKTAMTVDLVEGHDDTPDVRYIV